VSWIRKKLVGGKGGSSLFLRKSKEYIRKGKEDSAMLATAKPIQAPIFRAKITSKGQITVPVAIRKSLGVKAGDNIRFEQQEGGIRVVRDADENPFEKWRGIGTGFAMEGKGRKAIVAFFREMRGHDDLD
jgi:AbrB family looped-hinge helix DNA binding protein